MDTDLSPTRPAMAAKPQDSGIFPRCASDLSSSERRRLYFRSSSAEHLRSHVGHGLLDGARSGNFETLHGARSKVFRNSWSESAKRANTTHQRHFVEHPLSEIDFDRSICAAIAQDSREMRTTAYRDLAAISGDTTMRRVHCAGHARFWPAGLPDSQRPSAASAALNRRAASCAASGRSSARTAAHLDIAPASSRQPLHSKEKKPATPLFWSPNGSPKAGRVHAAASSSHVGANWNGV